MSDDPSCFGGFDRLEAWSWHRAETEGFEPSVPVRVLHLSRVVH